MPNCVRNDRLEAILAEPLVNWYNNGQTRDGIDMFTRSREKEQEIRDIVAELIHARKTLAKFKTPGTVRCGGHKWMCEDEARANECHIGEENPYCL
jgi:hypothetical protein